MKLLSMHTVLPIFLGALILSACSGSSEPSEADIRKVIESQSDKDVVFNEVKKLGDCVDYGDKPGTSFACDAEVDVTNPRKGRNKITVVLEIAKGKEGRWVFVNMRYKIAEYRGRYSDPARMMTIVFEPGKVATVFRKDGGSVVGKYEKKNRDVKILNSAGETVLVLNEFDNGTLGAEVKGGTLVLHQIDQ